MASKILLAVYLCSTATVIWADECEGVPQFIAMYGEWESLAVRAEPARIFEEHPEWLIPHPIFGSPTEVCPGIRFVVQQEVDGETVTSQLTYVYDSISNKSFGVITSSSGARLRGEIEHGEEQDLLMLLDFDGNIVWTESKVWISDDEFTSEGIFDFHGQEGHVWFRTYRITEGKQDE